MADAPMTPERFRECLRLTRRTLRGYKREIEAGALTTLLFWADGTIPVPDPVARHLERDVRLMEEARRSNPPPRPEQWRRDNASPAKRAAPGGMSREEREGWIEAGVPPEVVGGPDAVGRKRRKK